MQIVICFIGTSYASFGEIDPDGERTVFVIAFLIDFGGQVSRTEGTKRLFVSSVLYFDDELSELHSIFLSSLINLSC